MDSRQLRYFCAVADALHFGQAAERIGVAQSALSLRVQKLEGDLGVRLLNRGKRAAVSLTAAGEAFLVEARAALRQLDRAERIGRLSGRGEIGELEVGYVASAAVCGLLPSLLGEFRQARPEVRIRLSPMDTPGQIAALGEGAIDVGFIRPRGQYPTGVAARLVHEEELVLSLAADHPLAVGAELTAAAVADEAFIIPVSEEGAGFDANVARLRRLGGSVDRPVLQVSDFMTVLTLVSAGHGVALVPSSMQALTFGNIVYRPIRDAAQSTQLCAAWRPADPSPVVPAFVSHCLARTEGP